MIFGNVVTAMLTPFHADGTVNYEKAQELAVYLLENGSDSILVAGTTGESPTLTGEEKIQLLKAVKEAVGNRAKIICGSTNNNTQASVDMTKKVSKMGADGILAVVPYYNKPPQEGLYQHFKAIAECTDLPVILYNVTGRTGTNMQPETVARLAEIKNIAAVKEAGGSVEQAAKIRSLCKEDFAIYSGDDALTLPMLAVGACGIISVAAHIWGKEIQQMVQSYHDKNTQAAKEMHLHLLKAFKTMFITSNPIPVKAAMNLLGWNLGPFRLPLVPPSSAEEQIILQTLQEYGLK